MAKLRPDTKHAGHTSRMPFRPAMAHTSQNGTITEKKGSCRPTIALNWSSGKPVTRANAMIGVPNAP